MNALWSADNTALDAPAPKWPVAIPGLDTHWKPSQNLALLALVLPADMLATAAAVRFRSRRLSSDDVVDAVLRL